MTSTSEELIAVGYSKATADSVAKNAKLAAKVLGSLSKAKEMLSGPPDRSQAMLMYTLDTKFPSTASSEVHHEVLRRIVDGRFTSEQQLAAAFNFAKQNPIPPVDGDAMDTACGVGVVVTQEDIEKAAEEAVEENKEGLVEQRYWFPLASLVVSAKTKQPWATGKAIKDAVDARVKALLGEKTEADKKKKPKEEKSKGAAAAATASGSKKDGDASGSGAVEEPSFVGDVRRFHSVGENHTTAGYEMTEHTRRLLKEHVQRVGGKVHTRFPPEPNGILHIGHAKAMLLNFKYAKLNGGNCYFRFDDTNPEKEEERYYTGILDMVHWLGHKPYKITNSSDYFQELYDYAVQLIRSDDAYVCHASAEDVRNNLVSPWRTRPIADSLRLFDDMKRGLVDEGVATLRLKHTMADGKRDPIAYRIKFCHHFKSGDKWCVYPTYDYSHCLVDSLEDITHSLCTKEFQIRRPTYYWLCNHLNIYCPVQWEYGRLSIQHTLLSKRKIQKLIVEGVVSDWDDPRLHTLMGLRRRGFPPEAINAFVEKVGITEQSVSVEPAQLEASAREYLNPTAARTMVVLDPLKITLSNALSGPSTLTVRNLPDSDTDLDTHEITLSNPLYIERTDFSDAPEKGYRRLTPNQSVGLRYAGLVLTVEKVERSASGEITELVCSHAVATPENKPKAFVHWVSNPCEVTVRMINVLFLHKFPEDKESVPEGWLSDINPNAMVLHEQALADRYLTKAAVLDRFQFERTGFFTVDSLTTPERMVFNQIVGLKEDKGKQAKK